MILYPPQQYPPQQYVQVQPEVPKKDIKALIGAVFAVIALVLVVMAIVSPWWSAKITVDSAFVDYSGQWDASLQSVSSSGNLWNSTSSETKTWGQYNEDFKSDHDGKQSSVVGVFNTAFYLTIITLVMIVLGVVFSFLVYLGKIKPVVGSVILILAIVLALVAPLMFALQFPGAMDSDIKIDNANAENPWPGFMGSSSSTNAGATQTNTWGAATGWYMMIVAMVMLLIAEALVSRAKKPSSPAVAPVYPAQQPQYAQQPMYPAQIPYGQPQYAPAQQPAQQYPPQQGYPPQAYPPQPQQHYP